MLKKELLKLNRSVNNLLKAEDNLSDALESIYDRPVEFITYLDRNRTTVSLYSSFMDTYKEIKYQREALQRILKTLN